MLDICMFWGKMNQLPLCLRILLEFLQPFGLNSNVTSAWKNNISFEWKLDSVLLGINLKKCLKDCRRPKDIIFFKIHFDDKWQKL